MAFPATFASVVASVKNKQRLDPNLDTDRIKDWVNQAYADAASRTGGVRRSDRIVLAAFQESVPVTLGATVREITVVPSSGFGIGRPAPALRRVSLAHLSQLRAGDYTQATPSHYSIVEKQIELWRRAAGAEAMTVYYSTAGAPLVADDDVPELPEPFASKILEFGALKEAADFLRDVQAVQEYTGEYERWIALWQQSMDNAAGDNIEARGLTAHAGEAGPDRPELAPTGRR